MLKKKFKRPIFIFSIIWIICIFVLGAWWLYLILNLGGQLNELMAQTNLKVASETIDFINLAKWEGPFFLLFLLLTSSSLFYLYAQDIKRSKNIQSFFASLTHELKTPLASIRLQSDVITDLIGESPKEKIDIDKIKTLMSRLNEDSQNLEVQLDKILQFSRIEQNANLSFKNIDLVEFFRKVADQFSGDEEKFQIQIIPAENKRYFVRADEFALSLVLRNLIDNTFKHTEDSIKRVEIRIEENDLGQTVIHYADNGGQFKGELGQLGQLFYKFNSSRGSGIGLYLSKKLIQQMKGQFRILKGKLGNLEFSFALESVRSQL